MHEIDTWSLTADGTIELKDGTSVPTIGLGTFGFTGEKGVATIARALQRGYRLLDTAVGYDTEHEVGRAIRECGLPRDEIVITTKIRRRDHGYDATRRSVQASLDRLGTDRVDLYLIHWPNPGLDLYVDTWRGLIAARADGQVRSIGVSNFNPGHLERVVHETSEVPAVNQIELHPHFPQTDALALHRELGIQTQGWSPLGLGRSSLLRAPAITDIASRRDATAAQVVLRWHQQRGSLPIPRSADPGRQTSNIQLAGLDLDDDELDAITALGEHGGRLWGGNPETEER